ncbi:MAG: HAD family hydrolase [Spirochaetales bacterium]
MEIRAVAFDVDGTLYSNARMYLKSLRFALLHARHIRAYARVRKVVRNVRPVEDFRVLEREMLAAELGISSEEAGRFIDHNLHVVWESVIDRVGTLPGVRSCLEELKAAGLPMGVSSDFPVHTKLERLGLAELFDCEQWTEESGYLKPHPEPFNRLAECLDTPPQNIVYVGNSYTYDVIGAKQVGMIAVHLARRPHKNTVADYTTRNYQKLCSWILSKIPS